VGNPAEETYCRPNTLYYGQEAAFVNTLMDAVALQRASCRIIIWSAPTERSGAVLWIPEETFSLRVWSGEGWKPKTVLIPEELIVRQSSRRLLPVRQP
jgi:hypothetical protein